MAATILAPQVVAAAAEERDVLVALARVLARGEPVRMVSGSTSVELPTSLVQLLAECVRSLAQDRPVTLIPPHRLLTLEEAADVLNVPRVNAHRVLSEAELPVIEVGEVPRVKAEHVLAYRERRAQDRRQALAELVAAGQELDPEPAGD